MCSGAGSIADLQINHYDPEYVQPLDGSYYAYVRNVELLLTQRNVKFHRQ